MPSVLLKNLYCFKGVLFVLRASGISGCTLVHQRSLRSKYKPGEYVDTLPRLTGRRRDIPTSAWETQGTSVWEKYRFVELFSYHKISIILIESKAIPVSGFAPPLIFLSPMAGFSPLINVIPRLMRKVYVPHRNPTRPHPPSSYSNDDILASKQLLRWFYLSTELVSRVNDQRFWGNSSPALGNMELKLNWNGKKGKYEDKVYYLDKIYMICAYKLVL